MSRSARAKSGEGTVARSNVKSVANKTRIEGIWRNLQRVNNAEVFKKDEESYKYFEAHFLFYLFFMIQGFLL